MLENQTNFIITDQTYLYDFSYRKRVDLIAKYYSKDLNYKVIVFGYRDNKKSVISNDNIIDLTVQSFNKLFSFLLSSLKCKQYISRHKNPLIVENLFSTFPIIISKLNNFHVDLHGEVVDEIRTLKNLPKFIIWLLYKYENFVLKKCTSISVCSNNHRKSIQYRLAGSITFKNITVLPNVTEINIDSNEILFRDKQFEEFVQKSICIVYSGSALVWQNPEKVVNFFKLLENFNNTVRLLILTKDLKDFKNIIDKEISISKDKIFLTHCDYSNVNYYYNKCSFGIVFRDFSRTNFVSSPTKVIEYAKNNLGILYTGYIGDFLDNNYDNCGLISCENFEIESIDLKMQLYLNNLRTSYIYPYELKHND